MQKPYFPHLATRALMASFALGGALLAEVTTKPILIDVTHRIEIKGQEAEICVRATNISATKIALGKVDRDNRYRTLGTTIFLAEGNIVTGAHSQPLPVFSGEDGRYDPTVLTILNPGQSVERCIKASLASFNEPIRIVSSADRQFQPPHVFVDGRAEAYPVLDRPVSVSSICTPRQKHWDCIKQER